MSVLLKPWKFIELGSEESKIYGCEDDSIFTLDGEEVIGCSEWVRGEIETFEHIVMLHNEYLKN